MCVRFYFRSHNSPNSLRTGLREQLGPRPEYPEWQWMQPTGFAIGATNGLMRVEESKDHDTFIAWACASDSVVTPWVLRVRRWVGGAF